MHARLLPCGGRCWGEDGWWVRRRLQVSYLKHSSVVSTQVIKIIIIVTISSSLDIITGSTISTSVSRESYEGKRIELFNLDPSFLTRHTFWSQVIGQDNDQNCQQI